ncbi:MAG TPA: DUF4139 domain-containing protein [Flavobacteriales bacterium]|nr:DUF4139 domain-containing protein [Flavobacteriales bacterium]
MKPKIREFSKKNKLTLSKSFTLTLGAIVAVLGANAQKELKTTAINLFKNGTCFIAKEGNVSAPKGTWSMSMENFNPLLSTFWITTQKESPVNRIEYITDTIKSTRPIANFHDALNANKGKRLRLTYTIGTGTSTVSNAKGTLENFYPATGMAKIKTQEGAYLFLNTSNIYELFFETEPNERVKSDSLARVARIVFDKEKNSLPLKLSYMQSGMNWVPGYSIKMLDDSKLQLSMNALVENFSEDIKDAELTLTLGAANFKYGQQVDPLAQFYLNAVSGGLYGAAGQGYGWNSNSNYNYQSTYNNAMAAPIAGAYDNDVTTVYNEYNTFTTAGDKDEDLYRYKLGKVNIPKNSKTSFSIFSADIPYEDIYEINLSDIVNYASNQRININDNQTFDVFHSLKLSNTTPFPFTTAPVFVQDKNLQPLAQDQIKYTPSGGKVKVQLAKATDIQVKMSEEEAGSEEKARKYNSYFYKRVTIKGTVKMENLQSKSVKVCVTKYVNGDVKNVSDSGTTKKSGQYNGLNPYSETEWTVTLGKGEKKELTYQYDVYVYQGY